MGGGKNFAMFGGGKFPLFTEKIAEGKTKEVWTTTEPGLGFFVSKDDLTAGDGKKHDIMSGKAALANQTTSNVFRYLNSCGVPTAFVEQYNETTFLGKLCNMVEFEMIARSETFGSFLTGYPEYHEGDKLPEVLVQFNLKTTGKQWMGIKLPCDDPLLIINDGKAFLYQKDIPFEGQEPFWVFDVFPLWDRPDLLQDIVDLTKRAYQALESAWQTATGGYWRLVDCKFEFGIDHEGKLVLADVVDSDSWRIKGPNNEDLSKQAYRDGADLGEVKTKYEIAAEITGTFLPAA